MAAAADATGICLFASANADPNARPSRSGGFGRDPEDDHEPNCHADKECEGRWSAWLSHRHDAVFIRMCCVVVRLSEDFGGLLGGGEDSGWGSDRAWRRHVDARAACR